MPYRYRADPEGDPALDLRQQDVRVDDLAHIRGNHNAGDAHVTRVAHRDVCDRGEIAAEGVHQRETASPPRAEGRGRCRASPGRLFGDEIQHAQGTRILFQHGAPERERVGTGLVRNQIHEGFDRKDCAVRADTAPEGGGNRTLVADIFDQHVADRIGNLGCPINRIDVDAVLEGRRQPTRHDRGAGDTVMPGGDPAVLCPRLQPVVI